jgi:flagellar basal-body rod protein FlgF
MIRGLYAATEGMITQYKKIDLIGNNISNINTAGYKENSVSLTDFGAELTRRSTDGKEIGTMPYSVALGEESTDFSQGTLKSTNINTDLAINGTGFFAVESPSGGGVKYTRSGDFSVDAQGYLALPTGERLLSSTGTALHVGGTNFTVGTDGTVTRADGSTGKISLYTTANTTGITLGKDGFYSITGATAATGQIKQGWLEDSNTDMVDNMTGMMSSTRNFQSCQQAFKISNETVDKLVNQVGSNK